MEKLDTSLAILRYVWMVLRQHPRLLVFPLLLAMALLTMFELFFPTGGQSQALGSMLQAAFGSREAADAAYARMHGGIGANQKGAATSPVQILLWYLLSTSVATFINVAFCSQILAAMNGGRTSVARGIGEAARKLPAIVAWSLLAGTVGMALRLSVERLGFLWRWAARLFGFTWSAASLFVIPVLLNEPQARNPAAYLRISTALLRRVWGQSVIGLTGFWLLGAAVGLPLLLAGSMLTNALQDFLPLVLAAASAAAWVAGLSLAWQVFACGLYVYATEGVVPGSFDADLFERAWVVR